MGDTLKRYLAELIGTAVLVIVGCGAVAIGGYGAQLPLGVVPIGFAFGLAVMMMVYTIGPISGCHINPAVTVAFAVAGRMRWSDAAGYIIAQVIGGLLGALVLVLILSGKIGGNDLAVSGLGANAYGEGHGGYGIAAAMITEVLATAIFTAVILGVTQVKAATGLVAGLAIGLTLFTLHLPFVPVTGLSVNPARSIGPAVFVGGDPLSQIWLFIVFPLIGGAIAGLLFRARILSAD